jgi:hypothetical protein
VDQPVQGHGTGELDGACGEAVTLEDRVESQPLPELEADVEGSCGAWLGDGDGVGMDRDEIGGAGLGKRTGRRLGCAAWRVWIWRTICSTSGSGFENKLACPTKASSTLRARRSQSSAGRGLRSPKEQMTLWRGPLGVWMDSTSK